VFKRRIYLATLILGIVVCVLCWLFLDWSGTNNLKSRLILSLALSFEVTVVVVLLRSSHWIPVAEVLLYSLAALALVINWYLDLTAPHSSVREASRALIDLALWSPIVYILAFVALASHRSVLWGSLFLVATLVMGLGHLVYSSHDGQLTSMELYFLVRYGLAGVTYMALLSVGVRLNERYVRARIDAEAMTRLAHTDPVLDIANRRHLYLHFEQEMERAQRYGRPLSVLMFDMDRFKQVNDTFGHDVGDDVLVQVARAVTRDLRKGDNFGRWGGEEFMILAPETGEARAAQMAERLRVIIAGLDLGRVGQVTASFGVAEYEPGTRLELWLKRVDQALYRAKGKGRNRVEIAEPTLLDPEGIALAQTPLEIKSEDDS
jgi:diguanylate cyclase (GGDEF)-like protein